MWAKIGVSDNLIKSCEDMGWARPTPVQDEVIPLMLTGSDVAASAPTGAGKTGSFILPLIQLIEEDLAKQTNIPKAPTFLANYTERDIFISISDDAHTVSASNSKTWGGVRLDVGITGGSYVFKIKINSGTLMRVGWGNYQCCLNLGIDSNGIGYGATGKKSFNKDFPDYGETFGAGDVIYSYFDYETKSVSFAKNGTFFGKAFHFPNSTKGPFFPVVCLKDASCSIVSITQEEISQIPQATDPDGSPKTYFPYSSSSVLSQHIYSIPQPQPLGLIVVPTKDLALQSHQVLCGILDSLPDCQISRTLIVGGINHAQGKNKDFTQGKITGHIITGTVGAIESQIKEGSISLAKCSYLILDEADQMIESQRQLFYIYSLIPKDTLQITLTSATLHNPRVREFCTKLMQYPNFVDLKGLGYVPETVHHTCSFIDETIVSLQKIQEIAQTDTTPTWESLASQHSSVLDQVHNNKFNNVNPEDISSFRIKISKLYRLEQIIKAHADEIDSFLVFSRTNADAKNISTFLSSRGLSSTFTNGSLSTEQRLKALNSFKFKTKSILVASDSLARGIDISELPCVINFTLPDSVDTYIHRSGRVGRADNMGLCISLVGTLPERVWFVPPRWKGSEAKRHKLVQNGGTTIWLNEKNLLSDIEARIGETIVQLDEQGKVPPDAFYTGDISDSSSSNGKSSSSETSIYGKKRVQKQVKNVWHTLEIEKSSKKVQSIVTSSMNTFLTTSFDL